MAPAIEDASTAPVYLDGVAAMPPLPEAERAVADALQRFADPDATHAPGRAARATLEHVRAAVADAIGADPDEVILTTSGTAANALAILGLVAGGPGRIVVSSLEHWSVSEAAHASGLDVVEVPCDEQGSMDVDRFAAEVARPGTRLASVHHASPDVGTMQSVAECARLARAAGVLFHTDACQSVAHLPLDARALGIDLLSISSRKAYGPSGAGALFARRGLSPDTLLRGRGRHTAPTLGLPALAGMAAALTAMRPRVPDLAGRLWALSQRLRQGLEGCGRVLGHPTWRVPHIVSVAVSGVDRETLFMTLEDRGIQAGEAATGALAKAGLVEPDDVVVRFGLTAHTTAKDVDRVVDVLPNAVERLRGMAARAGRPGGPGEG
jgi:cysteine desulfurase